MRTSIIIFGILGLLLIGFQNCSGSHGSNSEAASTASVKDSSTASLSSKATINPNCVNTAANLVDCDLLPMEYTGGNPSEIGVPPQTTVRFTNRTGQYIQINQVYAQTNETTYWSEFCVFLNNYTTGQAGDPGIGEVGCTTKNPGESYPPLQWDGVHTALSVAPGDQIYIGSHTEPTSINHNFTISAYLQSSGIHSYRAPKVDRVITCNGTSQSTDWNPLVNTTSTPWHVMGATIYAVSGHPQTTNQVDAACIYILNTAGVIRFSSCNNGLQQRGMTSFATQIVQPGESLVAQASNNCPAGSLWDWVAYMYVW